MRELYNRNGHYFAHTICALPILFAFALWGLYSCSTKPDIRVDDMVIGGYEGPAGGPVACTEVHTQFLDIPPAHYDLRDCLDRLIGKVYLDGAALNKVLASLDAACTSLGSCTYAQQQGLLAVKQALSRAMTVAPRRKQ